MTQSYNRTGLAVRLRQLSLVAVLAGGATAAQGQFFTAANVVNRAGTYTDLATTGTAITTPNFDDANSAVQTIPFSFSLGGTAFTQFTLNTNGFIKLGATAPVAPFFSAYAQDVTVDGPLNSETNVILPFNTDLEAGTTGTEYRMAVTGTAPSRVLTIQWKNVSDKTRAASATGGSLPKQFANFSFQVKLYETTNNVEFVYNSATPSTNAGNANFVVVGIKGGSATQAVTAVKASNTSWSQTAFQNGVYMSGTNAHNIRNSAAVAGATPLPDAGRTYSFNIPVPNDAAVSLIYAYGKLLVPAGQPATLSALISNTGTTALTGVNATLNITGANTVTATQVVNSLAPGASATVTFASVAVPVAGNNTVTVTVPNDGNNTNNSMSMTMVTDPTTTSFVYPGIPQTSSYGFRPGAAAFTSAFVNKFTLLSPRDAVAVNAVIGTDVNVVGSTVFGVMADATTGAILARSPDYVVTTADLGTLHTFTLSSNPQLPAGDFLAGLAQVVPVGATQSFPMAYQAENPARPDTYFSISVSGAPAMPTNSTANNARYMIEAVTAAPATCPPPTAVTATAASATSASVSFTGPTNGTGYTVVYVPQGTTPTATSPTSTVFTASPYTLPGLSASTCYDIYVRANCGATDRSTLAGPVTVCTPCVAPIITTFPYTQNFDVVGQQQPLPCGVVVTDNNADTYTWRLRSTATTQAGTVIQFANSAPNALVYNYNQDGTTPGDDWFYLPAMTLRAGSSYEVSFDYKTNAYDEGLEVKYGTAATPSGQTTLLYSNPNFQATSYATAGPQSTPAVARLTPATTGTYYIGFHAISLANGDYLAVDNVRVGLAGASASAALGRAVRVYPNPSADGVFSLQVRGANAGARGLGVEVVNTLGQVVYTGAASDNAVTGLDLSGLAAGVYVLKVRNGAEHATQQIAIVK